MKLIRLAILNLTPPPTEWSDLGLKLDNVVLRSVTATQTKPEDKKGSVLIQAEIELSDFPEIDNNGLVIIPEAKRKECEKAIETWSNFISILARCKRSISSPHPPVALIPENDEVRRRLEATNGIQYRPQGIQKVQYEIKPNTGLLSGLEDRLDGVSLLAEALSHSNASGQYREYIRFFELAFALASSQIEKKLYQFLQSGMFGYERIEIKNWLSLRDPATHGDKKKSTQFVLEADVRPIIGRIEQAAMDVLFNKADWHAGTKERRDLWKPTSGTTSAHGNLFIVQGTPMTLSSQVFDGFGVYPWDLSVTISELPNGWWSRLESSNNHPK